jgi:predicted metalloprotease with PDZ domain
MAQTPAAARTVRFKVEAASLHAHLFQVTLTISQPAAQQRLSLPVWIPGSYLVREFSKNLQGLAAQQGAAVVGIEQLDKNTWQLACDPAKTLVVRYAVYALDNSVRTAWLDAARGFFNGTSLFLRVDGQTDHAHELRIAAPRGTRGWQLATGLQAVQVNPAGFGRYRAANYDELADCPVEMGAFWRGSFKACGVPHRFVVAGALPSFDGARLLADTQKVCETAIRLWHPEGKPPHKNYVFMLNAVDDGYGGLEHRNSTALICNRKDLPRLGDKAFDNNLASGKQTEGYTTLLGLISHEYFHTWNVKRLRPAEFTRYDYNSENYTRLLWFFEGFTSYYDDLLLCRAGLIDNAIYLKLLNKTINQVMQTPGRLVQSVAQSSFDAWVKYYRQDENTPNATVSYYTKGALVALCLDLTLRAEGKTTLDHVMRGLWARCAAGPMAETDLLTVLQAMGGRSFAKEIAAWVHGKAELPLKPLLEKAGVSVQEDPAQLAQALGLRVQESSGVVVKAVLRGGAAEAAGLAAGDEWLAVEVGSGKSASAWRIGKLDDLALYAGGQSPSAAKTVQAIVSRDKRLLKLPLTLPKGVTTWRLVANGDVVSRWLKSI